MGQICKINSVFLTTKQQQIDNTFEDLLIYSFIAKIQLKSWNGFVQKLFLFYYMSLPDFTETEKHYFHYSKWIEIIHFKRKINIDCLISITPCFPSVKRT